MKTKITSSFVVLVLLATLNYQLSTVFAQGTAFTYQGRLNSGGISVTGLYDLRFAVYDGVSSGTQISVLLTNTATGVTNGYFMAALDFGSGIFTGPARWLEIGVRTNGSGAFTTLAPRQPLTPTPYAIMANSASNLLGTLPAAQIGGALASANLSGTYGNAVTLNNAGNSFSGAFHGNGSGLTGVNAATVGGLGVGNFWQLGGNAGTTAGVNYLGTADAQPLYLDVSGSPLLILGTNGSLCMANSAVTASGSVVLGYGNYSAGGYSAVLGGQSNQISGTGSLLNTNSVIGGGYGNYVSADTSVIGGGVQNAIGNQWNDFQGSGHIIGGGARNTINYQNIYSTIGGGYSNYVDGSTATIAGGSGNYIMWGGPSGGNTISGGYGNLLIGTGDNSTIGGGDGNYLESKTDIGCSVVGGGEFNTNTGDYATIPGGNLNLAAGDYSFAAGYRAKAVHRGAFVWADSTDADFSTTANNQFLIRAAGGVGIGTTNPAAALDVQGDIKLGPLDQYFATAGAEKLRIVRGIIQPNGTNYNGTGYTVSHLGTGSYSITFNPPFTDAPALIITPYSAGSPVVANCNSGSGSGYSTILTWVGSSQADTWWNFVAIGGR